MITTANSFLQEKRSLDAMLTRRQLDIVWSTTPIQPLQPYYVSGNMLQIILQKSRHMINIGDIDIQFRPVVQMTADQGVFQNLAQKLMLAPTLVCAEDALAFQSATVESNQIRSQSNFSLSRTSNLPTNYINQLENIKKRDKMKPEHFLDGLTYASGSGSNLTGFSEVSITHPKLGNAGVYSSSFFEGDAYPRALYDTSIQYNAQFCTSISGQAKQPQNPYFAVGTTAQGDSQLGSNFVLGQYPAIALCLTPSICVYKQQQSRFAHFRQRFQMYQVSPYPLPDTANATQVLSYRVNQGQVNQTQGDQLKMIYCVPINCNGKDTSYGSILSGSNLVRTVGQQFTSDSATYVPPEQYTNVSCKISQMAIEFNEKMGGIGMVCMDSSQWVLQFNVNNPECCLSSYLQPSFLGTAPQGGTNGPILYAQNAEFLNACLMPQGTTITLTDVCLRIPYYSYIDEQAYSIVRELCYKSQPYYSYRMNIDPILGDGQMFSRLSIGGSSLIAGVFLFIVPQNAKPVTATASSPTPSDCSINLQGVNVPQISDLRCNQPWDSYYVNMQDVYVQVNNRRYMVNAIPISNPALATYLVTQAGIESAFGKFLNIPLTHYLMNRWTMFIPINPYGDRSQIITDNQLIVSCTIDFSPRVESSRHYGESNLSPQNKFSLLSVAVTMQSLVDCSYVKID